MPEVELNHVGELIWYQYREATRTVNIKSIEVFKDTPVMPFTVSIHCLRLRWCIASFSTIDCGSYLTVLRKLPEELHCQICCFHVHQS
jgi:hypothetical protein